MPLVLVGSIKLRLNLMDLLKGIKLDWLLRDIHSNMVWIMKRLLLLLQK